MRISEYLNPGLVKLDLRSETKDDLFVEMVQLFVKNGLIQDADEAVRVLEELAEISRLFAIPEFARRIRSAHSADEVLSIIAAQE